MITWQVIDILPLIDIALLKIHCSPMQRLDFGLYNTYNTNGLLTKCEVKMAGYWPSSFFVCLWTETNINSQKKNEANIQPS